MNDLKLPLEEIEKRLAEIKAERKITKAREEAEKELKDIDWKVRHGFSKKDERRVSELEALLTSYNFDR